VRERESSTVGGRGSLKRVTAGERRREFDSKKKEFVERERERDMQRETPRGEFNEGFQRKCSKD
jgi:hypothetical protein